MLISKPDQTLDPSSSGCLNRAGFTARLVAIVIITPMVQAEATSFPPVLAIRSTFAFSVLFGPLGVLLAAPLTLFLMAAVEVLYVQKGLGEAPETETLGAVAGEPALEHAR